MEVTPFVEYFFFLLDIVKFVSAVILFASGVVTLISGCLLVCTGDWVCPKTLNTYVKMFMVSIITSICAMFTNVMVSDGKALVAMYVISKNGYNETVQQLSDEHAEFVRSHI